MTSQRSVSMVLQAAHCPLNQYFTIIQNIPTNVQMQGQYHSYGIENEIILSSLTLILIITFSTNKGDRALKEHLKKINEREMRNP